jgi:hypothetical protein
LPIQCRIENPLTGGIEIITVDQRIHTGKCRKSNLCISGVLKRNEELLKT